MTRQACCHPWIDRLDRHSGSSKPSGSHPDRFEIVGLVCGLESRSSSATRPWNTAFKARGWAADAAVELARLPTMPTSC